MLERCKYINSLGESIQFGEFPYFVNMGDMRDYEWAYESGSNKITAFSKSIRSFNLPVKIVNDSGLSAVRNHLYEVIEHDVLTNQKGRLYVGDYYIQCNIIKSEKSEYLNSKNYMVNNLTVVTDCPFWIKETTFSFAKNVIDFENFKIDGYTNESFQSVAEDGSYTITAQTASGGTYTQEITSPKLCSIFDVHDVMCRNTSAEWGVTKNVECIDVESTDLTSDISATYNTYHFQLDSLSTFTYKNDKFTSNVQKIDASALEAVDYQEGTGEVASILCEDAVVYVEICGTEAGVADFTLNVSRSARRMTHTDLAEYTHSELAEYTHMQLGTNYSQSVTFALETPLYEGDSIKLDADGSWKIFRGSETETLSSTMQSTLNNLRTFEGYTRIVSTGDDVPFLKASFKSAAFYNNRISNTEFLLYPVQEFLNIEEDGNVYVRCLSTTSISTIKLLYQLQTPYFSEYSATDQAFLEGLCDHDDINSITVTDPLIFDDSATSSYPHDYPYGYGKNQVSIQIDNAAMVASNFIMKIYGAASDPSVEINDHTYKVLDSLDKGDYIIINSSEKTITKVSNSGTKTNIFNKRYKAESIFEKLPDGTLSFDWLQTFGFDLTILEERSEPKWT